MNPIERLKSYHIPTYSFVAAIQNLTEKELRVSEYRSRIKELSNIKSNADDKVARYHYLYLVQELVRQSLNTDKFDMEKLHNLALEKATTYVTKNPWLFAEREDAEPKLDAAGNVKQKKGAKKEQAIELWNKHKNENMTRKQWIDLLVTEVGLTPAGASTYHANLKANRM